MTLDNFIDETIAIAARNGYYPNTFIDMRQRHGTIGAISRLVISGDIQSGFKRLTKMGLVDHTIETAVLKFPGEFKKAVIECAEFRLRLVKS